MEETKKDNKSRILFLEHYLTDHSDKENPVTTEELLDAYEKQGLKAQYEGEKNSQTVDTTSAPGNWLRNV